MTSKNKQKTVVRESRSLFAELFGTFALTFIAAGTCALGLLTNHQVDYLSRAVAPGLLVMAMVYTLGKISGMHINPAVTIAFAVRRDFEWRRVPGYIFAQLLGATLAAALLHYLLGKGADLGATVPHPGYTSMQIVVTEIILTAFLVVVVIGTATGSKIVGHNAGIAVGGTVVLCGVLGETISGPSMNPAVSFGPLLVAHELRYMWMYIVGPVLGALLAVGQNYITHGRPTRQELEVANGRAEDLS